MAKANPYWHKLHEKTGENVTIDRSDAPSVTGNLAKTDEFGCTVATGTCSHPEASKFVFIAWKHVRGIGYGDWDHSKIGG